MTADIRTPDRQAIVAAKIVAARRRWSHIAREIAGARAAFQALGITPGLGLDIWSSNAEHYATQVRDQLVRFEEALQTPLVTDKGKA